MRSETPTLLQAKSWLKSKLQIIKPQISEDVLISILVCLISGDKHLILTCEQENIEELKTMTEQVFHHVFGLTSTTIICDASQNTTEFTNDLSITESNLTDESHNDNSEHMIIDVGEYGSWKNVHELLIVPKKLLFHINTTMMIGGGSSPRKNMIHNSSHINQQPQPSPVTPSEYTFSKKKHESTTTTSNYELHSPFISNSRKLANAVIIENLSEANECIYAFIMDEMDRFFINYTYEGGGGIGKSPMGFNLCNRKGPIIRTTELDSLSENMETVTIHNDIQRYMRDIVVGLRTHRLVKGGLTAPLAAIFDRNYATPELVLFASEKVFSHRLILRDIVDDKSLMYGTKAMTLIRLRSNSKITMPSDVVADVLQAVWPPV
ncbi:11423_t:CDS:2 [Diversispora eburnea]|uniref:11423_t:CDS:1 n=1 Tax=Diversispora eburnea TaxID=1213867 RepID=A0A9N9ADT1_9GLOM|nr:11423_t:CDS:2 [Diversispora eburnea]